MFRASSLRFALMLLLPGFAMAAPASMAAELAKDAGAEQVAHESFVRMQGGNWESAAALFDPAELSRFRRALAPLLEGAGGDEVATMLLGPEITGEKAKALSDAEFLGKFMRAIGGMAAGLKLERQDILGGVPEGPDRVHLVTRNFIEVMGTAYTKLEVVTLNRTPDGWRMAFKGEFENVIQGLTARFQKKQGGDPEVAPAD